MKEVKKKENEKWRSEKPVITTTFEKADSLTSGLHQVNDNICSSEIDQDGRR